MASSTHPTERHPPLPPSPPSVPRPYRRPTPPWRVTACGLWLNAPRSAVCALVADVMTVYRVQGSDANNGEGRTATAIAP
jgi:hypothetical protein